MNLPDHKTKIVATIGPASSSPEMLTRLIRAGVNVARLNFSHGDFPGHKANIEKIRAASRETGLRVAIMADLPGPKMRLGTIDPGPIVVAPGDPFTLTTEDIIGSQTRVSMSFDPLPRVVKKGDRLYLNDGLVQMLVESVNGPDVHCTVAVGGELSSRKGLNLPGIDLGISAFTDHDLACLEFALENGVDAVSQSFVESAQDLRAVREAAASLGHQPFLIAKIERFGALKRAAEIIAEADGIMIARGDLGVEAPIKEIAVLQKNLIAQANEAGKPVITATQMLESMTHSRLPTRAEATDVANAILDGTDCVMLSGESAVGNYPEESVRMLADIAAHTERYREEAIGSKITADRPRRTPLQHMTHLAAYTLATSEYDALLVATRSGNTARTVARGRPSVWVLAAGTDPAALQGLAFSYGVHGIDVPEHPERWSDFARKILPELGLPCNQVMLVAGPSKTKPESHHRLELFNFQA